MIIKKTITIIFVLAMGLLLGGCIGGGDDETPQPTDETSVVPTDRSITLIWWNLFESQENVQPLIDAYQAKYPNVTIEYSEKSPDDYIANLETVLLDNQPETTPDIFTVPSRSLGRYQNYTISAPTDVIDLATYQSTFYPAVVDDGLINATIKGIPLGVDSLAIVYNKDLFAEAGYTAPATNWTDLFEQAQNMTTDGENGITQSGLSLAPSDNSQSWFGIINLLLLQSNVDIVNTDGTAAIFGEDTATEEAVSYFKQYSQENIWDDNLKADIGFFLDGNLAMYIAPSWRLLDIIEYNQAYNLGLDYGIAPMPQLSSIEADSTGWADYWMQTVAFDSQNYKVAWDFLNFATQPEQQKLLYDKASETRAFGQIYSRLDMKSELESDENLGVYVDQMSIARSWGMVSQSLVKAEFEQWLSGSKTTDAVESSVTNILNSQGYLRADNL